MIEKNPFILIFTCEDPWLHLQNITLPENFIVLSGLRGLKKRSGESEALLVASENIWVKVESEEFSFEIAHPIQRELNLDGAPFLKGEFDREFVKLVRDNHSLFPVYYTRVHNGFIFSPFEDLLAKHYNDSYLLDAEYIGIEADPFSIHLLRKNKYSIDGSSTIRRLMKLSERKDVTFINILVNNNNKESGNSKPIESEISISINEVHLLVEYDPLNTILIVDKTSISIEEYYKLFRKVWPFLVIPI